MTFKILAISGSTRAASTNTAFLRAIAEYAPNGIEIEMFEGLGQLPIFSVDHEVSPPAIVADFKAKIDAADASLISSPEYVRAIPGGLKNAIDWLVSGNEIVNKPIALAHASHRGEDMLHSLRLVLNTVSTAFFEDIFLRIPLIGKTHEEARAILNAEPNKALIEDYLKRLKQRVGENQ